MATAHDSASPDSAGPVWGTYADELDIPQCPTAGRELVVDTTADEPMPPGGPVSLEETGEALSLLEALWIAAHQGGPHTIRFAPSVFPVGRPGHVVLSRQHRPPPQLENVCVDGRRRGVVIEGALASGEPGGPHFILFGQQSLLVGLTLFNFPWELKLSGATQMAGCRALRVTAKVVGDALIGPGNVFGGTAFPIVVNVADASRPTLRGNDFGFDRTTGRIFEPGGNILLSSPAIIEQNSFGAASLLVTVSADSSVPTIVRHNSFGLRASGARAAPTLIRSTAIDGRSTLGAPWTHRLIVGPGNQIRYFQAAIRSHLSLATEITENSITENTIGIDYRENSGDPTPRSPVEPPKITEADGLHVTGSCAVPGRVEVFSDAGDQGETFLGAVSCQIAGSWDLQVAAPSGRNVTATLTDAQGHTSVFSAPRVVP